MHPVEEYQNYNLDCGWVEWVQLWRPQEEGGVELLYNSVKTGSQLVWRPDPLLTRCGRENQHPAEWALWLLIEQLQFGDQTGWRQVAVEKASTRQKGPRDPRLRVADQTSWWEDAGLRNMSQRGCAPRPPVEQPRRRGKKRGYGQ